MADNSQKKGRHTKYSNKIGLFSNSKGSFIKNDTDVVLNFPFKDAVLEAGMSKEDVGREERFLNLEIDSKDIDTLEEPKVLTDFRYVDKNGEKPLTTSSDVEFFDASGSLMQNLLIKGNNLLALYTLREKLAGKVKLIYIDPPYNTGNDGFRYNDKFNHSAWLSFMKNRLEVAKTLISDDGSIFVQCDDNEQAYLKVLMDEIFDRNNYVATIVYRRRGSQANLSKNISAIHDYILIYQKTDGLKLNKVSANLDESAFKNPDNDSRGAYVTMPTTNKGGAKYTITTPTGKEITNEWRFKRETYDKLYSENRLVFPSGGNGTPRYKLFLKDKLEEGVIPSTWWDDAGNNQEATREVASILGTGVFDFPKAEALISKIITMATNKGDVVLDFCLGSGTTSAVAHKMNRRWVGIEQMNYIEEVAKERLKKVVAGEQGGISQAVSWQDGGSFVYCELKKYNQEYVDRIMLATSLSELEDLYVDMRNNAFLKFWFDRKEFEKDENFRSLDIDGRKQKLVDVLDENQLYLNYADMNDTRHNVTADEKTLTNKFYGTSEN